MFFPIAQPFYYRPYMNNRIDWGMYVNKWVLFKNSNNQWIFGKLTEYNTTTGNMKIMSLQKPHDDFRYIQVPQASIIEAWSVASWSQFTTGATWEALNWNDYINQWVLMKTWHGKWIFGIIREFNTETNLLRIQALNNGKFEFIEYPQASIIEGWVVDRWSRLFSQSVSTYPIV